ncbi:alkylated DNA repair [Pithovirus sibericum]|uniref:Alkylated DNA repair protein n=1 Tax=Pithovirus sibericum TaxID=1450746 RepID=W5S4P7_9VIRU|nr:alkylated DNA repair [Pithovirus sibericum]AHH01728.1 alkylated DNA repair protein [Pithovirus sibericum]WIL05299.1 alkylated DNA repair protein [Pithovirus mammoth]
MERTPEILISTEKSRLWIVRDFTSDLYSVLQNVETLHEPPIFLMGKSLSQRRDVGFYSEESAGYRYSGAFMKSIDFSNAPILKELLRSVNSVLSTSFNGILVNRYRNGEKYLSAHSDSEAGLDKKNKRVVGLAYGAIRTFRIRDKKTRKIVLDIPHEPCMLIVMEGEFQSEFTHEIPKQKKVLEERISLTFRHHIE